MVLIVLNNPNYGGCGGGGRADVPMGVDWTVIAHEFGHGIGGFADEYSASGRGAFTGGEGAGSTRPPTPTARRPNGGQFINPTTPLPTGVGSAANYNQGPRPAGLEQQLRRRPLRRRHHVRDRHLPAGRGLPDEQQHAAVLPGLLHARSRPPATTRPGTTSATRTPGTSTAAAAATCCCTTAPRSSSSPTRHRLHAHVQRCRARAGLVAVPAQRPVLRRRLQRRRHRRGRDLQRRRLGRCPISACSPPTAPAACG